MFRLERRHVHLDGGYFFIPFGKTKSARRKLPLSKRAADVLRRRLGEADGEYVFPATCWGQDTSKPLVKLNNGHYSALKRSGVAPFRIYDLRHTFATRAAEAGVDLVTLAALLGHSRIGLVTRYAHPNEQHQFAAIKAMEASREAKSQRQQQAS